jgi:hypothetical protein
MSDRPVPGSSAGRSIPEPGFAGDLGEADPDLRRALASYAGDPADPARHLAVLAALGRARLLVPVVAILGEVEYDEHGRAREKSSDMATVLLTGHDGRQALLGFTGLDTLTSWRADARPVPVSARDAASSALQEEAAALLLDVAGPTPYAVEGEALHGLARGWSVVQTADGPAWGEPVGPSGQE